MSPELDVWRLQTERHYRKIIGKRRLITVLVVRDQHDKIQSYAESSSAQAHLRKWWKQYNEATKTEELPASKELRRKLVSLFGAFRDQGYTYSKIIYGVRTNRKTGKSKYMRIHIFKTTPFTRFEKHFINGYFKTHVPDDNLALYIYHPERSQPLARLRLP